MKRFLAFFTIKAIVLIIVFILLVPLLIAGLFFGFGIVGDVLKDLLWIPL